MKNSLLVIVGLSAFISACSMDARLTSLNQAVEKIDPFASAAKTTGLVSGSQQTGTAGSGANIYYVQSSLGSYVSGMKHTTADGYTVYSSVQGSLVNEGN